MLIRIFATIFLLLSSNVGYTKTDISKIPREVLVEFNQPVYKKKYQNVVDNAIKHAEENTPNMKKKHIRVRVFIGDDVGTSKYSRYNKHLCDIKLAFKDETSVDFGTLSNEIEIITLHELGHCSLDTMNMPNNKIDWTIKLNQEEKRLYERLSKEEQDKLIIKDCEPDCNGSHLKYNIHIAYGEMFADLFSANYYFKSNNEDMLLFLIELRNNLYFKNGKSSNYFSHKVISEFVAKDNFPVLTYEEIIKTSQRAVIDEAKSTHLHP